MHRRLFLPDAVRSVVGCVKGLHASETPDGLIPRVRGRRASGRCLAIYASRARQAGSQSAHTAVIIQEAKPSEVAPLIINAYGLSRHEAQVTRLVLQGFPPSRSPPRFNLTEDRLYGHVKTRKKRVRFLESCRYLRSLHPQDARIAIICANFSPHLTTKNDTRVGDWAQACG